MFHLINGLFLDELAKFGVMPVLAHFGVEKILIDCGQLFFKRHLQCGNDFWIPLHDSFPFGFR